MNTIINSLKIMLLTVLSGIILFLICTGGGRLMIVFDLLLKPFIWVFTFPIVGPVIFTISGLILYTVLFRSPSPEWKKNEKSIFLILLLIMVGGWLASVEYAGLMFLLICLTGVAYPIIQIVRFQLQGLVTIKNIFK